MYGLRKQVTIENRFALRPTTLVMFRILPVAAIRNLPLFETHLLCDTVFSTNLILFCQWQTFSRVSSPRPYGSCVLEIIIETTLVHYFSIIYKISASMTIFF